MQMSAFLSKPSDSSLVIVPLALRLFRVFASPSVTVVHETKVRGAKGIQYSVS